MDDLPNASLMGKRETELLNFILILINLSLSGYMWHVTNVLDREGLKNYDNWAKIGQLPFCSLLPVQYP